LHRPKPHRATRNTPWGSAQTGRMVCNTVPIQLPYDLEWLNSVKHTIKQRGTLCLMFDRAGVSEILRRFKKHFVAQI